MRNLSYAPDELPLVRRSFAWFPGDIGAAIRTRVESMASDREKLAVLHERSPPH